MFKNKDDTVCHDTLGVPTLSASLTGGASLTSGDKVGEGVGVTLTCSPSSNGSFYYKMMQGDNVVKNYDATSTYAIVSFDPTKVGGYRCKIATAVDGTGETGASGVFELNLKGKFSYCILLKT